MIITRFKIVLLRLHTICINNWIVQLCNLKLIHVQHYYGTLIEHNVEELNINVRPKIFATFLLTQVPSHHINI